MKESKLSFRPNLPREEFERRNSWLRVMYTKMSTISPPSERKNRLCFLLHFIFRTMPYRLAFPKNKPMKHKQPTMRLPIMILLTLLALLSCRSTTTALSSSSSTKGSTRVSWKGLADSAFRHPLDFDLTSLVRSSPFNGVATNAVRRSLSVVEEGLRLQLLSSSVKVSPSQLSEVYSLLEEACEILDLSYTPELYIQSSSVANAYTLAVNTESSPPIVVVTSALLDQCSLPEIQAIIGHELGHLKCEHSLYLTLGSLLSSILPTVLIGQRNNDRIVEDWRLAAEYSCDRAALLVAQDIKVVNGAMVKLFAGTNSQKLNTEAFVAQCLEYEQKLKAANPLVRASIARERRSHPLPVRRVAELERYAKSEEYETILKRAAQLGQFLKKETVKDYTGMTVVQLKNELRSRGLGVQGKKADLIERLQAE